jgi:hypothetical protein
VSELNFQTIQNPSVQIAVAQAVSTDVRIDLAIEIPVPRPAIAAPGQSKQRVGRVGSSAEVFLTKSLGRHKVEILLLYATYLA